MEDIWDGNIWEIWGYMWVVLKKYGLQWGFINIIMG